MIIDINNLVKTIVLNQEHLNFFERQYIKIFGAPIFGLRLRLNYLKKYFGSGKIKDSKILDAGCGKGFFTILVAEKELNNIIYSVDNDNKLIENNKRIFRKLGYDNVYFFKKNITNFEGLGFDYIISIHNLEHIKEDEQLITKFYNQLKTGGHLLIHVPTPPVKYFFDKTIFKNFVGHYREGYSLNELKSMLLKNNFFIEECYPIGNKFELFLGQLGVYITKGLEKNKMIYAFFFPVALLVSRISNYFLKNVEGTIGIICVAKK